jgi:diadenosine tetraphosphatase ApaH/serine/threonine PP2A family protein phosphatase
MSVVRRIVRTIGGRFRPDHVLLAIISDIHANLPALEAVLADIDTSSVDELWSLGDVVGYGADPDDCTRLVAERCAVSLVGNHDLGVLGELDLSSFSPAAAAAVRWTQKAAAAETVEYLRGLDPADESHEVALYHASPRDPVWEYVLWAEQAAECIALQAKRVSLVGHSHVPLFFVTTEDGTDGAQAEVDSSAEIGDDRWLINPGSVGQPRDRDPRAAWLELDTEAWVARWRRVPYDIDRAVEAIAAADLPEQLGRRLYSGQ